MKAKVPQKYSVRGENFLYHTERLKSLPQVVGIQLLLRNYSVQKIDYKLLKIVQVQLPVHRFVTILIHDNTCRNTLHLYVSINI